MTCSATAGCVNHCSIATCVLCMTATVDNVYMYVYTVQVANYHSKNVYPYVHTHPLVMSSVVVGVGVEHESRLAITSASSSREGFANRTFISVEEFPGCAV